jgi:hypothetical protein
VSYSSFLSRLAPAADPEMEEAAETASEMESASLEQGVSAGEAH